jgi:hypothetical protein
MQPLPLAHSAVSPSGVQPPDETFERGTVYSRLGSFFPSKERAIRYSDTGDTLREGRPPSRPGVTVTHSQISGQRPLNIPSEGL